MQAAVSLLPADVQASIQQVQNTVADQQPLISVAQTVAQGGAPSPAAITAALASAATLVTGNPIAGAAIAMAGGLVQGVSASLQGLFTALGLYSSPPPLYNYNGLRRLQDVVPSGQNDPDWWFIRSGGNASQIGVPDSVSSGDLWRIMQGQTPPGVIGHPPVEGYYNGPALSLLRDVLYYYDIQRRFGKPFGNTNGITGSTPMIGGGTYAQNYGAGMPKRDLLPFEVYVYPLIRQTLENWANGIGFVMPRDVLQQAAIVWNQTHQATSTVTFHPFDLGAPGMSNSVVDSILGGGGDLKGWSSNTSAPTTRLPPLTINTGPPTRPTVRIRVPPGGYNFAQPTGMSTPAKVAVGTAVVAGSIFAAGSIWAFVEHQTIGYFWGKAFDKAWSGIKGVFGK